MSQADAPPVQRVLVVDDEEDIRESLRDIIETCVDNTAVETADSGEAALGVMQRTNVDLVITDYRMGGMDGLEFLLEVQRLAPQVPRIMITAYPDIDLVVKAINHGHISNFLPKPFRGENVVQVVAETLGERRREFERRKALLAALNAMRRQAPR